MTTKDLAVETDTKLAELYAERRVQHGKANRIDETIKGIDKGDYSYLASNRPVYAAQLQDVYDIINDLDDQIAALDLVFAQHYWSRFFVCEHVHSSMNCHTLRPTSQIGWLPQLSGSNEAEIVDQLGEAACTVCFPDAPVNKPNTIELDPAKAARKAEREARAAELAAKRAATAITFADGSPVMDRLPGEKYSSIVKTERTALIAAVDALVYVGWGYGEKYQAYFEYILPALAHKAGRPAEEIRAELQVKANKKIARG